MLAIAPTAKPHKIFCYHSATLGLGDDMPALIRVPRPAGGAAGEAGKGSCFDGGGDGGFLGHDSGPVLGFPYFIARCAGGCKAKIPLASQVAIA